MTQVYSEITGLTEAIEFFGKRVPSATASAARMAINRTISRDGLALARNAILDQVAFPKDYLGGDRLRVSKYASETDLEGIIVARKRATSLARFAAGGQRLGSAARTGVQISVKRGDSRLLKTAWLVRLNKGASLSEDGYNIGLAVRVRAGDELVGKHTKHQSWLVRPEEGRSGVALLYGPSVQQVFADVAGDISPQIAQMAADEFWRQFVRLA